MKNDDRITLRMPAKLRKRIRAWARSRELTEGEAARELLVMQLDPRATKP
jgi:hypothetical protein